METVFSVFFSLFREFKLSETQKKFSNAEFNLFYHNSTIIASKI